MSRRYERVSALVAADPFMRSFYILRRASTGRWELPGGRVDAGESCRAACRRESLEELGVKVSLTRTYETVAVARVNSIVRYRVYSGVILEGDPRPAEETFDAATAVTWSALAAGVHPVSPMLTALVRSAVSAPRLAAAGGMR